MNKDKAELIYWALASHISFGALFDKGRPDYKEVKKAREQKSNRYKELRGSHSFAEADEIACLEWLESLGDLAQ